MAEDGSCTDCIRLLRVHRLHPGHHGLFVQDAGVDHRRVDVFKTEERLDCADIVTLLSEWVADEWQQWVKSGGLHSSLRLTGVGP